MAKPQDHTRPDLGPRPSIGNYRNLRLHLNPGGYWEIEWYEPGRGTQKHSINERDFEKAKAYFTDVFCPQIRAQTAAVAAARPPTVEELCQAWLEYVEAAGKAETGRRVLAAVRRELGALTAGQVDG